MTEKDIEKQLVVSTRTAGGMAPKLVSPGFDGIPDRLILMPGGRIGFVEVKAPGKRLRPLQEKRKRQLEALGFSAFVLDGVEQIPEILTAIQGGGER
ncbi:VRR-NUC domain-containing protein [Salisediminibacterium selenitireducens]|uniref:VRR-NUC domain protein n=1 Tax=Bacillus selenitireducens (strain ATCC 700615 / DSM 15326 / MLS10) TaxID=439292 RepID=D6XYZ5_BACIE|nr:VRR-NUC domain-containing protein [Salisediminibacterium selenitireducens]ADH98303.1 VRR-NUC domain protein [[Bacillus] selenitireducens MLS10]